MSKEGAKVVKLLGKKKINHYSVADCQKELARLTDCYKDKKGVTMTDGSKYKRDVQERLNILSAK